MTRSLANQPSTLTVHPWVGCACLRKALLVAQTEQ